MSVKIIIGDVFERLKEMPADSVDCCITSPPYWGLRDYEVAGQLGLEATLGEHINTMVKVFDAVRRVLKPHGTLWLNYGDCYATTPNGRSAADTKAAGDDDRTFRDKPFSTMGPVGDGFAGTLKPKDLCMIPNRLAIALQDAGWWVRSEIIWAKPNPMPESIQDRPTMAHEKIWLLSKNGGNPLIWRARDTGEWSLTPDMAQKLPGTDGEPMPRWRGFDYYYEADAVRTAKSLNSITKKVSGWSTAETGRDNATHSKRIIEQRKAGKTEAVNKKREADAAQVERGVNLRNVWSVPTMGYSEAHFATFPPDIPLTAMLAGCPEGGTILDPFGGAGTTGLVADRNHRNAVLIELSPEYAALALKRLAGETPLFADGITMEKKTT